MFYPNKLTDKPTIGVTAMSAGQGKYIEKYKKSILKDIRFKNRIR